MEAGQSRKIAGTLIFILEPAQTMPEKPSLLAGGS